MKKTKKLLCVLLAASMLALCLSACGSSASSTETTAAAGETTAASGETAAASGSKTLLLGGIGALTGDYANYGTSVRNGAQLAVDEINKAGGILGMQVSLDFQDSQADPDSAVNAYGKLMDSGMNVSLGAVFSGETTSVVAAAKEDDIMLLTPCASADKVITGNDNAFRVCFKDSAQGTASADYIASNNMATEVSVFYQSDIDYSVGLYNAFKTECEAKGITIKEVQTFTDGTKTDFSTQINAIKEAGTKLVFMPIYAAEASVFLTQAAGKLDADTVFFGCDGLDGILTKVSDTSVVENVMMLTPFAADSKDENVQTFVAAYKTAYSATPDQFAADGYDAVYVIKAAMEKANATDPTAADFTSSIVSAMTQITVKGVTGTMTWSADGETQKEAKAMIIHDGVAVLYEG
ncbi:MAG: ABC transporter substrate-binding protein [Oscillospiraceae bacterium]|nr:ABC transporter substrate-binding protein [Oscillospiraceae bacterium]